jgi:hypothetical protein
MDRRTLAVIYYWSKDEIVGQLRARSMHLTAEHFTSADWRDCVAAWLFKSTTAFHKFDNWSLPWHFGVLCWSYAFGGLTMFMTKPGWLEKTRLPYTMFALVLIFVQGMCT